ncbi:MAG: hypothetical protein R2880_18215 [Deinococcales bacterium]
MKAKSGKYALALGLVFMITLFLVSCVPVSTPIGYFEGTWTQELPSSETSQAGLYLSQTSYGFRGDLRDLSNKNAQPIEVRCGAIVNNELNCNFSNSSASMTMNGNYLTNRFTGRWFARDVEGLRQGRFDLLRK